MRILFWGVHGTISLAMFEDLAEAIKEDHDVAFEFEGYDKSSAESIVQGRGYPIGMRDPELMFVADPRCFPDRGCKVVDLNHGLASKHDYYYPTTEYTSDYFFVASDWIQNHLRQRNQSRTRFVSTGMPKLDRCKRGTENRLRPTVLICPTHNAHYNCLPMIEKQIPKLAEGYHVIIKPHMYTIIGQHHKGIMDLIRRSKIECSVTYNIADLLSRADIVISDVSSSWLEALGLGKAVVTVETPVRRREKRRKTLAFETIFAPYTQIVTEESKLIDAVKLSRPCDPEISERLLSYHGRSISKIKEMIQTI